VIITVRGLAAWLCAFAFSSAVAQSDVAYKAIVDASNAATGTVEVKVSFRGNSSGETVVVLPRGLANPDLEFSGDVRSIETNPALGQALVSHAPGAWISTSYRIQHGLKGRPASYAQDAYRPIILPDLTYLIGENTLVRPGWMTTVGSATVSVIGLAESASIFTSAPENKSPFTTDASLESLTNFVILSGPLRAHPLDDEESGRIVLAGAWQFSDESLVSSIRKIYRSERALFPNVHSPLRLIALLPLDGASERSPETGGRYYSDAFVSFAGRAAQVNDLQYLMAHETLHHWFPRKLTTSPIGRDMAWFSEGITDFLAYWVLLNGGDYPNERFLAYLNGTIASYSRSDLRAASNDQISGALAVHPDARRLPYVRGFLLGLKWEGDLRSASAGRKGVVDLVRSLYEDRAAVSRPLTIERVREAAAAFNPSFADDIDRYIVKGEPIPVPVSAFGACVSWSEITATGYDLGFDEAASIESRAITGLKPGSAAQAAGLIEGMKFRGHGKSQGDPDRPVRIYLPDGRTIQYFPRGKDTVRLTVLKANEGAGRLLTSACTPTLRAASQPVHGSQTR